MMETRIRGLDDFFKKVYNKKYHSVFTCCLGRNQTGKTNFALFQMERLHALGLGDAFGSNIPDLKADFEIDFIEDYATLKKRCQMLNPDPKTRGIKRYFFIADEMGDWAPKDQPWQNVKFIKELQKVRKIGLSMIACGIDRIDSRILNEKHFHGYFEKFSKSNPRIAKYFDWTNGKITTLKNIPQTSIGYDTFNSAYFYMEPQVPEDSIVPLNESHKIVKVYRETGSWKKAGVTTQQGKRELFKVLDYHFTHCLASVHEPPSKEPVLEAVTVD